MENQQNPQQQSGTSQQNSSQQQSNPSPDQTKENQHEAQKQSNSENTQSQASPPAEEEVWRSSSPEETKQELQQAIKGSNEILVTATTTLTLLPDTVTVDRAKLTITKRTFISSAEVMSIRIEDVMNVTATVGPLFGSVKIVSRVLSAEKPYTIGRFWRGDALRIKRITQGYVIALQRNIDCSSLGTRELADMLDKLGEDVHAAA